MAGNILVWIVWVVAALACLGSGIAVITFSNPFYSALSLIGNLASLAVLYLLLSAEFVAAAVRDLQGVRGHLPPHLPEADHAGVSGVQAAGLPALPRPAPALAARERAREVRRLLALRRRVPSGLHPGGRR